MNIDDLHQRQERAQQKVAARRAKAREKFLRPALDRKALRRYVQLTAADWQKLANSKDAQDVREFKAHMEALKERYNGK